MNTPTSWDGHPVVAPLSGVSCGAPTPSSKLRLTPPHSPMLWTDGHMLPAGCAELWQERESFLFIVILRGPGVRLPGYLVCLRREEPLAE